LQIAQTPCTDGCTYKKVYDNPVDVDDELLEKVRMLKSVCMLKIGGECIPGAKASLHRMNHKAVNCFTTVNLQEKYGLG